MDKIIDKSVPIEKIDNKTTQFIYDDGVIVFALDKDTCIRIVIKGGENCGKLEKQ